MTVSNSYFTWEIIWYIIYSTVLISFFGAWGYFSPSINSCIRTKTTKDLQDVFGQVFWRFFKCISISIGILGLLGAFMGIEKILDDVFKPDMQKYATREMENYRSAVNNLLKNKCNVISNAQSPCIAVSTTLDYINQGIIDKKIGIDFINKKIDLISDDQEVKQIKNTAERIMQTLSILNEQPSVSPYIKLIYSISSVYALAFALAVSFGESVFQYRIELIKDNENNKKCKKISLYDWFFKIKAKN